MSSGWDNASGKLSYKAKPPSSALVPLAPQIIGGSLALGCLGTAAIKATKKQPAETKKTMNEIASKPELLAVAAVVGVGAVGYGVYKLLTSDADSEKN